MVSMIAYGKEDGEYYVQGVCGEEHTGQKCACHVISTHSTLTEAKARAYTAAKILRVPLECWYGDSEPVNDLHIINLTLEEYTLIQEFAKSLA